MANRLDAKRVTMSHPAEWLAVLRIVVGLYFVKSLVTKMTLVMLGGVLPVPVVSQRWLEVMPKIVAKQAFGESDRVLQALSRSDGVAEQQSLRPVDRLGGDGRRHRAHPGLADGGGVPDRPDAGDQLRTGHAVDVARPAGLPPGAVLSSWWPSSLPGRDAPGDSTPGWPGGGLDRCWRAGRFLRPVRRSVRRYGRTAVGEGGRSRGEVVQPTAASLRPTALPPAACRLPLRPPHSGRRARYRSDRTLRRISSDRTRGASRFGPGPKIWSRAGRRCRARCGCGRFRTTGVGHTARPSGWRRFPSSPRPPARAERWRSRTRCRCGWSSPGRRPAPPVRPGCSARDPAAHGRLPG